MIIEEQVKDVSKKLQKVYDSSTGEYEQMKFDSNNEESV